MHVKTVLSMIALGILYCASLPLSAQGGGSPSSGASPSQGSATIENQIIAYEVLRQTADQIAGRIKDNCKCKSVLLSDPSTQMQIVTAKAFDLSSEALKKAYTTLGPTTTVEAAAFPVPSLSDISSFLTAIKSSANYSNQNFQPTQQSMITFLSIDLNKSDIAFRASNLPGDLEGGAKAVQDKFDEINQARSDIRKIKAEMEKAQSANEEERDANKKALDVNEKDLKAAKDEKTRAELARARSALEQTQAKLDKIKAELAQKIAPLAKGLDDVDKEFSSFRSALTAASPDGTILSTIIKGETLLKSLGASYSVLILSIDAAGGDTKVTHFFWRELILPTPSPSYNGGAVISFLLTAQDGKFQDGEQFHYMYDFSKLKTQKVPKTLNVRPPSTAASLKP